MSTVLLWCWYGALSFINMRSLVLLEIDDLDVARLLSRVAEDQTFLVERC